MSSITHYVTSVTFLLVVTTVTSSNQTSLLHHLNQTSVLHQSNRTSDPYQTSDLNRTSQTSDLFQSNQTWDLHQVNQTSDIYQQTQTGFNWPALLLFFVIVATVWGNVMVCLAVKYERKLRNRFNYFLVSLALSDMLCALLVMPGSVIKLFLGEYSHTIQETSCNSKSS